MGRATRDKRCPQHPAHARSCSRTLMCVGTACCVFGLPLVATPTMAADPGRRAAIAPVLARHCVACHGPDTQEGDLRLDTLGHDFAIPQVAARWRDVADRIRAGEMPPEDCPRPEPAETAAMLDWIDRGLDATPSARGHWAFQPLREPAVPELPGHPQWLGNWVRNEIDRFIVARQASTSVAPKDAAAATVGTPAVLTPSMEADRVTLIRRVTFDLIGLPPTPTEVAAFLADESPDAWERVVDRLLDSPHYGERWGRHWLDLAQYADSSGFHDDLDRPHAWKYRDYVIRSFNDDKPFGRFVAEQLAGDEIEGADDDTFIATGFCRNGPSNDNNMGKTPEALAQYRADQLDTVISNVSTVFLGLTIGCARCHNHKTEPLTSRDYYSLLAIFNGTQNLGLVPGTEDSNGTQVEIDPALQMHALIERSATVPATFIMRRGMASQRGDEVGPAVPAMLATTPLEFPEPHPDSTHSGRRRTLAAWIAAPDNPLTWRVLANRVWQHHFGRGIVATPSNFGVSGATPTHPELLDWLAARLVADGGRLKPLHRLILRSATYRQSSADRPDGDRADPANRLLWRMNIRRLEAEPLRDAVLAASGKLNLEAGGPGIKPRIRPELLTGSRRNEWPRIDGEHEEHWRRSVYIYVKRQLLFPMMELFDAPTTTDSCAVRMSSVVPTQALLLMNNEFVEDQAIHLANRASAEAGDDVPRAIVRMFEHALARPPDPTRLEEAISFVRSRERHGDRRSALADLAHVIFNSTDFLYVE
jgi:mono/diheme cytochrome c family protein